MAQEDQNKTQKCSNSTGNFGRSSKKQKQKQKKIPQRGLGVAQLEKIRLEEQHRKDAAVATKSCSSYLPLPNIPNFHISNQSNSPIPAFSSNSPPDFRPPIPTFHHCDFEKESCLLDPGLAFRSSISMPCEFSPIWHIPNWAQKPQQYQQPCSSMLNVSSGNSSVPIRHYMTEPPSNQNHCGNRAPIRPEEKMICMKRPYPFSFDVPPAPSFNFKLPAFSVPLKPNEATSSSSATAFNLDAGNSTFRGAPACSASNSGPNSMKSNKESENFNGDFLTLAPPTPTSCTPAKSKSTSTLLTFQNQECQDFESPSFQGVLISDQITPPPAFSHHFNQQQAFYSFFPPSAMAKSSLTAAMIENCSRDQVGGGSVDLNLKL